MRLAIALSSVVLAAGASANADIVTMHYLSGGAGRQIFMTAYGNDILTFAGQLNHEITAGTGVGASLIGQHITYCPDILQHTSAADEIYTIVPTSALPDSNPYPNMGAARAQALFDMSAAVGGAEFLPGAPDELAAAFQICVWEVVNDYDPNVGISSFDVTSGNVSFGSPDRSPLTPDIMAAVTMFRDAIGTNAAENMIGLANESTQDQLLPRSVPAPASAAIGLLSLGALARRRR